MQKLKRWVKRHDTKTEAARVVGMSKQQLGQILSGGRTPTPRIQELIGYQLHREITTVDRYIEIDNAT